MRAMRISKLKGTVLKLFLLLTINVHAEIPAENINHFSTIKWTKPLGNYDGFNIYRSDDCHGFVYLKHVDLVYRYVDQAVIGGGIYNYKVRSTLNGIESKDSIIVQATVPY